MSESHPADEDSLDLTSLVQRLTVDTPASPNDPRSQGGAVHNKEDTKGEEQGTIGNKGVSITTSSTNEAQAESSPSSEPPSTVDTPQSVSTHIDTEVHVIEDYVTPEAPPDTENPNTNSNSTNNIENNPAATTTDTPSTTVVTHPSDDIARRLDRSDSVIQLEVADETAYAISHHQVEVPPPSERRKSVSFQDTSIPVTSDQRVSVQGTETMAGGASLLAVPRPDGFAGEESDDEERSLRNVLPVNAQSLRLSIYDATNGSGELGSEDNEDTEFLGWDRHGFPLNPDYMQAEQEYFEKTQQLRDANLTRWTEYMATKEWHQCKTHGTITKKLKKLVRGGVPDNYRSEVWKVLSGIEQTMGQNPGYYQGLLDAYRENESVSTKQVDNDLQRTFPNHKIIDTDEYLRKMRRVLVAYSWRNPKVGYCQSMNFVCATALLFLSEEETFWLIVKLSEDVLVDYYSKTMLGCQVDIRVLQALLAQKFPRVARHLESQQLAPDMLTMGWFLTIFVNDLPVETMLRVWDVFLCEGVKVIFRVGLALFKVNEARILKADNLGDLMSAVRSMAREAIDSEQLMDMAFRGIGSLPMRRIKRHRETEKQAILNEAEKLNRQRDSKKIKRRSWMVA